MSLKKHGLMLDCEHCRCVAVDAGGGFDVAVPLTASETGIVGTAKLHCVVSTGGHRVELVEWLDASLRPVGQSEQIRQRVSATLDFVAGQRICGNRHICPSEVSRIVEEQGRK